MFATGALWWLATSAIGWLSWPITARLFRHGVLRGYPYSRALGLLLLTYPTWLLASLNVIPHSAYATRAIAGCLAVVAFIAAWLQRRHLIKCLRANWSSFLVIEALYLVLFIVFTVFKSNSPAIFHTEQPMDMMMLSSLLRSHQMPPADAWFAGYRISYYYGGYMLVAQVAHLTRIPAAEAYNVGLVSVYATAAVTAFGVFYELDQHPSQTYCPAWHRRILFALAGVIVLLFASSLAGIVLAAEQIFSLQAGSWLSKLGGSSSGSIGDWWWWLAGRVFVDINWFGRLTEVITEFPAFSFILGDLHPHLMALPYALLAVGTAVEVGKAARTAAWWRIALCWATPLIIGALGWINTWDLPVYAFLVFGVYCMARVRSGIEIKHFLTELPGCAGWLMMSIVLFLPFYASLSTQVHGIGVTYYTKTRLGAFLLTTGALVIPVCIYFARARMRLVSRRRILLFIAVTSCPWLLTMVIGSPGRTLLGVAVSLSRGPWVMLILSAAITLSLDALWDRHRSATEQLMIIAGLIGAGLLYITEFFYLRDMFNSRMNTYFKLSYQAWILLSIASSTAAWRLVRKVRASKWLMVAGCAAVGIASAYTLMAAVSVTRLTTGTPSLDGSVYLRATAPGEYGAIRWLLEYAEPDVMLVEAVSSDYSAGNRLSAFTGIPTLLGWPGHQRQWRILPDVVSERQETVERIYTSSDPDEVLGLLQEFKVNYLYIGETEQVLYQINDERIRWFGQVLKPVFMQDGVFLFRVPDYNTKDTARLCDDVFSDVR